MLIDGPRARPLWNLYTARGGAKLGSRDISFTLRHFLWCVLCVCTCVGVRLLVCSTLESCERDSPYPKIARDSHTARRQGHGTMDYGRMKELAEGEVCVSR